MLLSSHSLLIILHHSKENAAMGKMKQIYLDLLDELGGVVPPDYDLSAYLAREKAEYEIYLLQEEEGLKELERTQDSQNDDQLHDNGSGHQEEK